MIQRFKNLWKTDGQKDLSEKGGQASFQLRFNEQVIGSLHWDGAFWHFTYSDEFKKQAAFAPLIDFPEVTKGYKSERLWPFFMHRIPSAARPDVKKAMDKKGLDSTNLVDLLRLFGERNISNPYRLLPC